MTSYSIVIVVEDDFDSLIRLEHEGVRMTSVDAVVARMLARRHDSVKGGNCWLNVCNVVEKRTK